jgi:hypothetical protein
MAVFEPRGNPIAGLDFRTMRPIGCPHPANV